MNTAKPQPELLSPAGDWESLRAAVSNGANAVYFGLEGFNARARATNFKVKELPEIMAYLHERNVRGFVTLNILIFSDELPKVARFVEAIAAAGVDAVIVQDIGLVKLIHALAPTLPIHASTQMTLTEAQGIEFVRELGVERVVLARELSLENIQAVTRSTSMPVEVFVHGALCVAYSGQCLTSEALGGRSANRGQCAQACRLPYEMIVDGERRDLGDRAYLLSPQDLAAYDHIRPLIEAGVISFKIEGRLKGGPYVASTTQTYRKAIDTALAQEPLQLSRREELDLAQTFSRGLTPGFLDGVNHQKLVRGRFPKSRGILMGEVVVTMKNAVKVRLSENVERMALAGDGILFDLGKPAEKEPGGRVWRVVEPRQAGARPVIELHFEPNKIDLSEVQPGCPVYKTDDPVLRKQLEQSYSQDRMFHREPITAQLRGQIGGELTLTLTHSEGQSSTATWAGPLESARKRPTAPEDIRDQLDRLGDTPFQLAELTLDLPPEVMLPRSVLNDLRRQASVSLAEMRERVKNHRTGPRTVLTELRQRVHPPSKNDLAPSLTVLVRNLEQLDAVLNWQPPDDVPRPATVYCDFEDLRLYPDAVVRGKEAGMPLALAPLRIWKPGEEGFQSMVLRAKPEIVLVRNLASIRYFQEHLPEAKLIGDFSLNVANELTAQVFWQAGLQRVTPSYDLNWEQFTALMGQANPQGFEVVVHQHMPMFHMEHCVFAAFLSTGKDHRDCGRPCESHRIELKDRVGASFPVHPDTGCRNTVFNSVAQSAAEYMPRMKQLGVRWFRVDLLRENPAEVHKLLEQYTRVLQDQVDGKLLWKQLRAINQLGVTRGTLQLA